MASKKIISYNCYLSAKKLAPKSTINNLGLTWHKLPINNGQQLHGPPRITTYGQLKFYLEKTIRLDSSNIEAIYALGCLLEKNPVAPKDIFIDKIDQDTELTRRRLLIAVLKSELLALKEIGSIIAEIDENTLRQHASIEQCLSLATIYQSKMTENLQPEEYQQTTNNFLISLKASSDLIGNIPSFLTNSEATIYDHQVLSTELLSNNLSTDRIQELNRYINLLKKIAEEIDFLRKKAFFTTMEKEKPDYNAALDILNDFSERINETILIFNYIAEINLLREKKYLEAKNSFFNLHKKWPEFLLASINLTEIYCKIGSILYSKKDFDKAENFFSCAKNLNSTNNPIANYIIGTAYLELGQDKKNIKKLEFQLEQYQKALEHFQRATQINDLMTSAWLGLASTYEMLLINKILSKEKKIEVKYIEDYLEAFNNAIISNIYRDRGNDITKINISIINESPYQGIPNGYLDIFEKFLDRMKIIIGKIPNNKENSKQSIINLLTTYINKFYKDGALLIARLEASDTSSPSKK